ncbi:inactive TPR repeat-containing thioredoxin TTL3 [Daucus carota subsp. sativus]|uniref:inactive TPR repeat-containing thioredoxin TTL3 n=1 Tax=Daucus carota subsp. sativus TaxID=79200 RepID=UPI0007B292EF|nr:PREDICTED: inactive TPR repeat-containing thioredoxin TTL3 [Daucus carota subsp. sativus]
MMPHSGKSLDEMETQDKPDFKKLDLNSDTNIKKGVSVCPKIPVVNVANRNHSGELGKTRSGVMGHRRSSSTGAPLIYSGRTPSSSNTSTSSSSMSTNGSGSGGGNGGGNLMSSVSSGASGNGNLYPSGNICPSGKILKSNMINRGSNRSEKLGSGSVNYGHGNIIKGGGNARCGEDNVGKRGVVGFDAEEVKNQGNELYKKGKFGEALVLYDKAIGMAPENAAYRSNKAAALTMLGRLGEAVVECEEAVRLDSGYGRAHQRLASLFLRLGQVENAKDHLCLQGQPPDTTELQKLQLLEKHISRCVDARKVGDWKGVLQECDAIMVAGAVSSPQIIACKAEAFLKLHQYEDADSSLSNLSKLEPYPTSCSQNRFFGILLEAYVLFVRAKVDIAFGRFENAAAAAEKAVKIDFNNMEVAMLLNSVKLVTRARSQGRDLFGAGKFTEACAAYGEGLKYNLCNSILYCNRAVCWSKLGLWQESVEDCNQALKIQPNYTKALLRRAVSNAKLEEWAAAVRDYEILRRELPGDSEVAESLSRAQDALMKLRRGDAYVKPGDSSEFSGSDHFKGVMHSPGGSSSDASRSHKKYPEL